MDRNFEQEYKKAFEAAKGLHDAGNSLTKRQMEIVFPQLAESEDERIRKFLIEMFSHGTWQKEWPFGPNEIVAWLEKQKEPHFTKRNALFDKCVENCDPKVMKKVSDEIDEMLQKEQKPAEWSEEDRLHYTNVLGALEYVKGCKSDYDKIEAVKSDIAWFKSLRYRPKPSDNWKPSEEQMRALQRAVNKLAKTDVADSVTLSIMYDNLKKTE